MVRALVEILEVGRGAALSAPLEGPCSSVHHCKLVDEACHSHPHTHSHSRSHPLTAPPPQLTLTLKPTLTLTL